MAKPLFVNNWAATLQAELASGATSMTIETDRAALLSGMTGGDYYIATLVGVDVAGQENAWEIVKITANASGVLTIARAQEGTAARLWPAGTVVSGRVTAGLLGQLRDAGGGTGPGGGIEEVNDDGRQYQRRFEEWVAVPVFEIPEDAWTDTVPVSFTNSTQFLTANTVYLVPFVPPHDMTVNQVSMIITTAAASSVITMRLYESDAAGWPGTGLSGSFGSVSAAATGQATVTLDVPAALAGGRRYWLAAHPNGSPIVRAASVGTPVMGVSADGNSRYTLLQRSISWSAGAPDTWEFLRSDLAAANPPLFRLHRAAGA
ncbi:choice-of-anchor R domain-containing protein [Pseudomonas tohonis]|uniref:choice-of-anchor R domain-containing protein n=1 Tax=Pseudomonas tohonis TaxID=2725477 RepID=UPI0022F1289E|nr:choice-of-anchor R domain-containing protein [Pseudomonas tohonis]